MALTDNIISYWKLDESSGNPADSLGTNNLTNNNTTPFASAKINNGGSFTGASSQSFSITNAGQTGLNITGNFTVSLWVNSSSLANSAGYIGKSAATKGWLIRQNSGTSHFEWIKNQGSATIVSTTSISTGTWYHVVVTFDGSTILMYVNGSQEATAGYTAHTAPTADFYIGTDFDNSRYLTGLMDEIGIWSRALSGTEISSLYNNGTGLQYPFTSSSLHYRSLMGVGI